MLERVVESLVVISHLLPKLIIWGVVVISSLATTLVTIVYYFIIKAQRKAKVEPMVDIEIPDKYQGFAEENGFEYLGSYRMKAISTVANIAGWKHNSLPMFMCYYVVTTGDNVNRSSDFVTYFAGDYALTTGSTKDAHLNPQPPKSYMQSYANIDLFQQWSKHKEAERYLMFEGNLSLSSKEYVFVERVQQSVIESAENIVRFPLWFCLGAWRFFVRRRLWVNKSIEEQHRRGMIKMPHEAA